MAARWNLNVTIEMIFYICPATGHWNFIWSAWRFAMFHHERRESCALPVYIETHCSGTVKSQVNVDARYPRVWAQTLISQADKLDMWQTSERDVQERFTNRTQNDDYRPHKPFKEGNWNACLRLWNCVILHVGFLINQISKALNDLSLAFCCGHSDKWTFIFLCFCFRYLILMLAYTETSVSVSYTSLRCHVSWALDRVKRSPSYINLIFLFLRLTVETAGYTWQALWWSTTENW